jgi:uncharacterized protein YjbJ (UPF0337 family)
MGDIKDKLEGTFNEAKGNITDDEADKAKGAAQTAWGNAQSGDVGGAADKAKDAAGAAFRDATDKD